MMTREEFIDKTNVIHHNEFDYSRVIYKNNHTKIIIGCKNHGEHIFWFEQTPNSHLSGHKCPKCHKNFKMNTEIFKSKSVEIHEYEYDYSKVNYINTYTKVLIGCKKHGDNIYWFEQTPNCHLRGRRCPKCYGNIKYTNETFVAKCEEIWGKDVHDKYDFSLIEYKDNKTKIKIFCKKHGGIFEQRPDEFLHKHGCDFCNGKLKTSNEEFIKFCNIKHNFIYDYSRVNYDGSHKKIEIGCKNHGDSIYWFKQKAHSHKRGDGCPVCCFSKGELKIKNFLDINDIKYIPQCTFSNCKHKSLLPFDFYLPDYNSCIEYDGIQHDTVVEHFGGKEKYKSQKVRDRIKNVFCKKNNTDLLRISYKNFDKIEDILKTTFLV